MHSSTSSLLGLRRAMRKKDIPAEVQEDIDTFLERKKKEFLEEARKNKKGAWQPDLL
jgi:hypothetical protein